MYQSGTKRLADFGARKFQDDIWLYIHISYEIRTFFWWIFRVGKAIPCRPADVVSHKRKVQYPNTTPIPRKRNIDVVSEKCFFLEEKLHCPSRKVPKKKTVKPSVTMKLKFRNNIEERAYQRNDEGGNKVLLAPTNQTDLVAAEAKYHRGCAHIFLISYVFFYYKLLSRPPHTV